MLTLPDTDKEARKKNAWTNNKEIKENRQAKGGKKTKKKVRHQRTREDRLPHTHTLTYTKGLCVG